MTDAGPVMEAAGAFLAVRPRSVDETQRRLLHLGYPDALVRQVVDRLIEMDYLDDAVFARAWVESRDRARPRGETALRRELALKGVSRDVVDGVLVERLATAESGNPNESAALALLERRRSSLEREVDPARRRHKAYALLARNGFDPETCREASISFLRAAD
ncbi:MAG TPA: regulatory protein RecX [Candidatus Limnocylindrales bacterium]|nr:regulatory protein RecX [Candidatus Limnocylindrales bacterium]